MTQNPTTNTEAVAVADVAGIAASLTDKQRAVIFAPEGYQTVSAEDVYELLASGVYEARITPLGLLVKAHLSEQGATAS
jgi:hypothetical protein